MTKYGLLVVNNKVRKESILYPTEGVCKDTNNLYCDRSWFSKKPVFFLSPSWVRAPLEISGKDFLWLLLFLSVLATVLLQLKL